MANLVITSKCNLHCSFCFARDHLRDNTRENSFLSIENFIDFLDYISDSGMDEVRLIGGEPTLHPQFARLLELAYQRFSKVVIFSNGMINETALSVLEAVSPEKITVMINTSAHSDLPQKSELEYRFSVMKRLGRRAMAGYTIASKDFECDFLISLIHDTGCRTSLRIGLAQPVLDGRNVFISQYDYPMIGDRIAEFALKASVEGIRVEMDCGFVRCMFNRASYDMLREANALIVSNCNPVLDIDLDGSVSHCFPMGNRYSTSIHAGKRTDDLRAIFSDEVRAYRSAGIYPECTSCVFRQRQECSGGCLALTIQRFQPANFRLVLPW